MGVPATPAPDPDRWYAQEELAGTKVRLVPLRIEHAAGYLAALHSEDGAADVVRFLGKGPAPTTEADARSHILAALVARTRGERFAYAQVDAVTGDFIGTTSVYEVSPAVRTLAIGHTWLGKRWWRTGQNTESKVLLLSYAFDTLCAARVVWHTDIRNERSQTAIERLGATREGVLRKHRIRADGSWRDTVQYAMTDEDWPPVREQLTARLARG
jgi:RimJ/RimL family protein N-acetyltransferase